MKKTILNLLAILLLSPMALFANADNGNNPAVKTYKAYWIATTMSNQRIIVQEALVPEEALVRNKQGEFAGVKMDLLDKALNYSALTSINGATVTYNQFVLEEHKAIPLQANIVNSNKTLQTNDDRMKATMVCYGMRVEGWTVVRGSEICTNPVATYCIAQKTLHGGIPGNYYIIYCK